jgi:uncharacterized protein YjbI with pentapeptide repeats
VLRVVNLSRIQCMCTGLAAAVLVSQAVAVPATRAQVEARIASAGADLNLEAPGVDLSGLDFRGARLFGASLKGAKLDRAKLRGCNLDLAILRDATLVEADLAEASLFSSVLANAKLNGANLSGARMMGNMERANFEGADLSRVKGSSDMTNQPMGLIRLVLTRALDGAAPRMPSSRVDLIMRICAMPI